MRKGGSKKGETDLTVPDRKPLPEKRKRPPAGTAAAGGPPARLKQEKKIPDESESLFRSFFDSAGVMRGIVEVVSEDDLRHITDNAVTASFFGLTPEAMKNKLGSELGEPRDILRTWIDRYHECRKTGKPVTFEYADRRNGPETWLLATVTYLGTPSRGFPRFAYVVIDITDRRHAEAALRESEERMRFALEISRTGAWDLDLSDHTAYRSLDHDRIFGYTSLLPSWTYEMFIGHVIPEDRAMVDAKFHHAVETQSDWNFECRIRRTDGAIRWIWAAGRHRPGDPGRPGRMAGIVQDITERKQAEEALKESEERFRVIAETSPGLLSVSSLADGTILFTNPAYDRAFGYKSGEIIGKLAADRYHHTAERSEFITTLREKGELRDREVKVTRKDGTPFWLSTSLARIRFGGNEAILGASVDITKRKLAEVELLKSRNDLEMRVEERTAELREALDALGTERKRLYDVLEALPVYVCLLDRDYRMPFANRYFRETFAEPEGRRCYEFLFNRTEPCGTCETYTVMKTRVPHHWFWTGPNGRDYDIYDFPFTDTDGSPMILEMGIDITERKRAEEEWAILASIVEHSEDAIIGKSLDGTIMSWNTGAMKMYGYSAEEAVGRHVSMLVPPGMEDDLVYILNHIRTGDPVFRCDTIRKGKGGKIIQVALTISPIKNRNGALIGASTIARDITERKKAEEAIKKANAYNRSLIEASLDPLVTISPDGTISDVNNATIRVTGYARGELVGTDFSDYFTEPDKAKAGYERVFRDGLVRDLSLEIRHRDGRVTPVLYNASVYLDDAGKELGVLASARDITEHKKAEEAIKKANAYNRSLIEASLDPLVTIRPDGTISDVNNATIQVTGYSREELVGTDFSDYFTEPEKAKAGLQQVFRDGAVTDYPLEIRHRLGQVTPALYHASVYRDLEGRVAGIFAAARDVTERKKAEEELRKAHILLEKRVKERTSELTQVNVHLREEIAQRKQAESLVKKTVSELHAAIESTADGIYAVDRAGRIIRYNQNFASMWNIPAEVLLSGEDRLVSDYIKTRLKNPGLVKDIGEDHDRHKDRETFDMLELSDGRIFERYSKPQKMDSLIIGRVMSYRDVTDRRRAEEKLLSSLQEKETLIREIHHRVKNNLQIISGLLDMTRMRTADPATTGILTDMMLKIKTMAQIHTRLYESKQFDRINMGSQIRDQVADLSSIYGRSGAEIHVEIDAEEIFMPVDQAIPCALVVNEILSNAFKHAFRGREHGNMRVSVTRGGGNIRIAVRDDGIGIPGDVDVYRTTSLGFKLIRSLVMQLNGAVSVTGDHGTEVIVEFPFHSGGT